MAINQAKMMLTLYMIIPEYFFGTVYIPSGMARHRKSYAQAAMMIAEEQKEVSRPEGPAPWSQNGVLIGSRHYGYLCLPNPAKTVTVKRVPSCNSLILCEVIVKSPEAAPGSCCMM